MKTNLNIWTKNRHLHVNAAGFFSPRVWKKTLNLTTDRNKNEVFSLKVSSFFLSDRRHVRTETNADVRVNVQDWNKRPGCGFMHQKYEKI